MKIPVFLINGFLESGKTSFILDTIADEYFSDGEDNLIIACEEGMEEYDEELLKAHDARVIYADGKEAFTDKFLEEAQKKYIPTQIIIEYNGMWGMEYLNTVKKPKGWFLAQTVTTVDATTFDVYMQNMKSQFMDMVRMSDLVVFNRCIQDKTNASSYKRNIRAVNPKAQVAFEKEGGEPLEFVEELPYDINAPVIEIADEDFGIWYIDAMDHPEKYTGKTVSFTAMVFKPKKTEADMFVPGRLAMTCCAEDTAFIGFLCSSIYTNRLKNRQWVHLTAEVSVENRKEYQGEGPVLRAKNLKSAQEPKEELVYF